MSDSESEYASSECNSEYETNNKNNGIIPADEEEQTYRYRVTLDLNFRMTFDRDQAMENNDDDDDDDDGDGDDNDDDDDDDDSYGNESEPNIYEYMLEDDRYITYAHDVMMGICNEDEISNITFDGSISFIVTLKSTPSMRLRCSEIQRAIDESSFEDGMFEAEPGSAAVVPTKHDYYGSNELGLIDCRNSVYVTRLIKKKKKQQTEPATAATAATAANE